MNTVTTRHKRKAVPVNVLSLFDGISCGQLALHKARVPYETYYASEINKKAVSVTQHNFPGTIQLGDVRSVRDISEVDLLLAGSPCQGFSRAGKRLNFDDPRSALFFEFVRVLKETKPRYFLLENNRMRQEWQDVISEYLGVEPALLCSGLFSAQKRERLYWTNIEIKPVVDSHIRLRDVIKDAEGVYVYPRGKNAGGVRYRDKCNTITCSSWNTNFFVQLKDGSRRPFTPEEAELLQTIPQGYTSMVPKTDRFNLIGNAWTVDVIAHIFEGLK